MKIVQMLLLGLTLSFIS